MKYSTTITSAVLVTVVVASLFGHVNGQFQGGLGFGGGDGGGNGRGGFRGGVGFGGGRRERRFSAGRGGNGPGNLFGQGADDTALVDLTETCATAPTCGLRGNSTGIIVCRTHPRFNEITYSTCIDPTQGWEDDLCSVCVGDDIPPPCICETGCDIVNRRTGETIAEGAGVHVYNIRRDQIFCVSPEDSITLQLTEKFVCEEPCIP